MRYIAIPTLLLAILLSACAGFRPEKKATVLAISPENAQPKQEETYTLKRKVAIGRFTNDSRLATSFLSEGSDTAERLSRAANDILSAKLASTNRFLLIERADLQALENEQDYAGITSHKIPADYLILGSISEFGRNTTGNVGLVDRSKKQTAHAKVTLRIVDTRTGQVIFGEEGRGEAYSETASVLGMGSTASYDDTLPDKAIDAAISAVIQNLINKLSNDPWKSYVLNVEQDKVFISGGALQGIKPGDVFNVYKRGKTVVNPQSSLPIELPGEKIAQISVVQMIQGTELTELSIAKIIEGSLDGVDSKELYVSDK